METTIADYSRFISAVLQQKGISDESKKQMFSPQVKIFTKHQFPSLNTDFTQANQPIELGYGLGWGLFKTPYGSAFFKEGHDDGWGHYVICIPDKKTALLIMTNSSRGEGIFKELVQKIMGLEIPWEWEGYRLINCRKIIFNCQLSIVNGQHQRSTVIRHPSTIISANPQSCSPIVPGRGRTL
jgi:CubicO group peptidase (beta-lactamase class C family)